jgi:hypothetical protein
MVRRDLRQAAALGGKNRATSHQGAQEASP